MPTKHAAPPLWPVRQGARGRTGGLLPSRLIAKKPQVAGRVVCASGRVPGKRLRLLLSPVARYKTSTAAGD